MHALSCSRAFTSRIEDAICFVLSPGVYGRRRIGPEPVGVRRSVAVRPREVLPNLSVRTKRRIHTQASRSALTDDALQCLTSGVELSAGLCLSSSRLLYGCSWAGEREAAQKIRLSWENEWSKSTRSNQVGVLRVKAVLTQFRSGAKERLPAVMLPCLHRLAAQLVLQVLVLCGQLVYLAFHFSQTMAILLTATIHDC